METKGYDRCHTEGSKNMTWNSGAVRRWETDRQGHLTIKEKRKGCHLKTVTLLTDYKGNFSKTKYTFILNSLEF